MGGKSIAVMEIKLLMVVEASAIRESFEDMSSEPPLKRFMMR